MEDENLVYVFQFLYGSIQMAGEYIYISEFYMFQFLCGSIQIRLRKRDNSLLKHFFRIKLSHKIVDR